MCRHLKITITTQPFFHLKLCTCSPLSLTHIHTTSHTNKLFYPPKRCSVSSACSPTILHLLLQSLLQQTLHDTSGCFQATVAMDVSQNPSMYTHHKHTQRHRQKHTNCQHYCHQITNLVVPAVCVNMC